MKISVQTYTFRKLAKQNLDISLKEVKALGYENLEVARIPFTEDTARVIKNNDMNVISIQVKYRILKNQFNRIVRFCELTDCRIVVVSVLPIKAILGGKQANISFARDLNILASKYKSKGIILAFHHHNFEFKKINDKTKFDYLLHGFSEDVKIVVDTYWTRVAGINPENFINYIGNRIIGVHLRDYQELDGNKKHKDIEIGNGIIDFKAVIASSKEYAIYGAVEQNTNDPIKSLSISLDHLNKIM